MIDLIHGDCMDYMATLKDNAFELAIVDPPYGIGEANEKQMQSRHHSQKKYKGFNDLKAPTKDYFIELKRVSKNQIIWGANHFSSVFYSSSSCWLFWDKDGFGDFADGEIAYTSFKTAVRKFKYTWNGFRRDNYTETDNKRIHPTEKPVSLYEWLLKNYAKEGDRILDTHLGSGSSAIAAHNYGFDFVGIELDEDYFKAAKKRFEQHKAQLKIF